MTRWPSRGPSAMETREGSEATFLIVLPLRGPVTGLLSVRPFGLITRPRPTAAARNTRPYQGWESQVWIRRFGDWIGTQIRSCPTGARRGKCFIASTAFMPGKRPPDVGDTAGCGHPVASILDPPGTSDCAMDSGGHRATDQPHQNWSAHCNPVGVERRGKPIAQRAEVASASATATRSPRVNGFARKVWLEQRLR